MILINLSSDRVCIQYADKEILLDRDDLEKTLSSELHKIYEDNFVDEILVINGPGSFTSLRVGTLVVNLLNWFYQNKIRIYTISKPELYKKFVDRGFVGSRGVIYIGQRQKFWLYDFKSDSYEYVTLDKVLTQDVWMDKVYGGLGLDGDNMLDIGLVGQSLEVSYQNQKYNIIISELGLMSNTEILANYMIEANICQKI